MNSESNIKTGRKIFKISFLVGTAIFLTNILMNDDGLLFLGYIFLLLAILLNIGILITIIINAVTDKINRKKLLKTGGLMLLNIPIAFLYMSITSALMNIMIITFINSNDKGITDIKITGCDDQTIDMLETMEKQTLWIDLKGDCQIDISYSLDNERKTENVIGYTCQGLGKRTSYRIGKQLTK